MTDPQPSYEWLLSECTRLSVACMELEGAYLDTAAERDRLRKVLDAVKAALAAQAHGLGEQVDAMLDDVANDVWHCRCGKRYPAHRKTCPSCGRPRVTS